MLLLAMMMLKLLLLLLMLMMLCTVVATIHPMLNVAGGGGDGRGVSANTAILPRFEKVRRRSGILLLLCISIVVAGQRGRSSGRGQLLRRRLYHRGFVRFWNRKSSRLKTTEVTHSRQSMDMTATPPKPPPPPKKKKELVRLFVPDDMDTLALVSVLE
jgi:hypothetical protein